MNQEKQEQQEQKRERILAAALKQFATAGFFQADLELIAREAQVGKGTLYRYFKNKEDLYLSAVGYQMHLAFQYIENCTAEIGEPRLFLERYIEAAVEYALENLPTFKILGQSRQISFSDTLQLISTLQERHFLSLYQKLEEGVQKQQFRPFNSKLFLRVLESSVIALVYGEPLCTREELKEELSRLFLFGLLREEAK